MEKKSTQTTRPGQTEKKRVSKPSVKLSEYGRQLKEKQKLKEVYGMREAQFRRFFKIATRSKEATGETLLTLLERRLDNVIHRIKLASTHAQARQMVVHGHVLVNGKRVSSPSYLVTVGEEISLDPRILNKTVFIETVVDKRLNSSAKVPEWIELDKNLRKGNILRLPVRADIQMPVEEHLIVELYSK